MDRPKGWETLTQEIYTECRTVCLHLTTTTEFQRSYRRGQFYATQGRAENRGAKETKLVQPLLLSNLSPRVQREHLYILRYNQHFFNVNRSIPWNECSMNHNIHARIHANRLSTYVHSRTPIEIETDRQKREKQREACSFYFYGGETEDRRKDRQKRNRERERLTIVMILSRGQRDRGGRWLQRGPRLVSAVLRARRVRGCGTRWRRWTLVFRRRDLVTTAAAALVSQEIT